jgi:hypothetical protein
MEGVLAPDPRGVQFFERVLKETENKIYNSDLYNEVWRDIFCSFPQQIGADSNPYFSLDNLFSLNMTPMRIDGEDDCPPHLLDVDAVKRRVKEEYSLIKCIEASFPNTDGLGSNKDTPFVKANLGGTVLLIIRTYVMEVMLRSLQVFYWFRYKTPGDVDDLFVQWLARFLTADIENKGYFEEFETEVLDLYNRNIDLEIDQDGNRIIVEDYDAAIKFLVRQQIYSVSNRLSRLVGSKGDISLDSILLEEWLPTIDVPAAEDQDRFSSPPKTAKDDLNYASEDLIKIFFKGELSEYRIKSMNGDPGIASRQNQYENILYQRPMGQFFREYYGANVDRANNPLFDSVQSPNVPNGSIWSKNKSPETEAFPKLNYGPEGNSQFTNNAESPLANGNREQGMLGITSFLGSLGTTNETIKQRGADLQWGYFKQNIFPEASKEIQYRLGVSQPEIGGMDTVIKFVAAAAKPELFEQEGYSFKFGGRNPEWYFPGWSLRKIEKSTKARELQFRDNYGFSQIFGDLAQEYGIPPAEDENGPRFDWWTFEANNYVYEGREAKQADKPEVDVERKDPLISFDTYFPPPDPNQKPDSLKNMNSRVRDRMKEFIENGNYGPDRLNYRTEANPDLDTFGYGDPEGANIRVWSGDPNYVKFGEFKTGRGEPYQEALITNPQNRYVNINVPGLGEQKIGPFVFAPIDDNYLYFGQDLIGGQLLSVSFNEHYYIPRSVYQDPWKYKGPDRTIVVSETPTVNLNGETIPWATPAPGTKTILNPDGNRGDAHIRLFNHAYAMLGEGIIPYISIMDFDLLSIQNILGYEKQYFEEQKEKARSKVGQRLADINFNNIIEKYDNWINEIVIARGKFAQAQPEREKIRKQFVEKALAKQSRRPMETPLTLDFKNGGLILEPYIRVTRLDPNADYEDEEGAGDNIKLVSSNGDEYLEDIVNIDKFQDFLNEQFGDLTGYQKIKIKNQPIPDNIVKVCGGDLPIQAPNDKISQPPPSDLTLGDFFDNLSLGIRLSYVAPIEESTQDSFFESLIVDEGDEEVIDSSKAYLENGANTIPIVSTEIPFNMNITIDNVLKTFIDDSGTTYENGIIKENKEPIGFFRAVYKSESGLTYLLNQMDDTDEYKTLFKYMFPIDKMLSINNIYASTYLSTFKDVDIIFDATKEQLKLLMFTLLDSGNYRKSACQPSNRDVLDSLLNGFPIAGLAGQLAITLLRSSVLIFKGFMETADINIILTRRIIDLIHTVNQGIAQAQILANQADQAIATTVSSAIDLGESLAEAVGLTDSCSDLLVPGSCKVSPTPPKPREDLFDPVNENFIPEPPAFAVSLALLPATIFAPFFFGPPLTIPFGFIYWGLDYKPSPNWLNSIPPSDWLNSLFNKSKTNLTNPDTDGFEKPFENCTADLGLPPPTLKEDELNDYYNSIIQQRREAGNISNIGEEAIRSETKKARRYLTDREKAKEQNQSSDLNIVNNPLDDN